MAIEKTEFEATIRIIRKLYCQHVNGDLTSSELAAQGGNVLKKMHTGYTRSCIEKSLERVKAEMLLHLAQFELHEECLSVQVFMGRGGPVGEVTYRPENYRIQNFVLFVGPRNDWNKVTTYSESERADWTKPNLYAKRYARRWKSIEDFDVPDFLSSIREAIINPPSAEEQGEEIPF